jgi:ParB/RepB/Spo0J family partition protein
MAAVAEAITTGIQDIPLSRLFVAPWNARKTFDEHSLAEITASITQHGIQVPLTVRPIVHKGKDSLDFEIVAGHRRRIGAERAARSSAPCIVRDLTDAEAREIGMIDNLQRENLPPLDEARAFAELIKPKGATAETVAAKLGKEPGYILRRLKLLNAIQPIQEALAANAIEVGHALEIARLDEKQQAKLFHWLGVVADGRPTGFDEIDEEDEDEFEEDENDAPAEPTPTPTPTLTWRQTGKSVAELRREITRTMLVVLSTAPFPLEDNISPMACAECPKRTVNSSLLFSDVAQDICTDSECFRGKVRAWVRYSLQHAEEEGKKLVLLGSQYWYEKSEGTIIRAQDVVVIKDGKDPACNSQEDAIWYDGPQAGHPATICRATNCKTHYGFSSPRGGNTSAQNAAELEKQQKERKQTLAKVNVQKRYRNALFVALGQAKAPAASSAVIDQLAVDIVSYCITRMTSIYNGKLAEALGWDEKLLGYGTGDKLVKHLASLPMGERLRAAHLAIQVNDLAVHEYSVNSRDYRPAGFERLAQLLSVDHKALLAVEEERQQQKAKAAAESAKKKTEKAAKPTAKPAEAVKADAKPAKKTPTTKAAKTKPAAKSAKKAATKKTAKAKK